MLKNVKVNSRSIIRFFMYTECICCIWQVDFESIYFDLAIFNAQPKTQIQNGLLYK